ncbi:MAG TPA: GNAT family N-acetyltransferase [Bacteroidota bacterium]|nr:GNAT family N-acetyltransferase [Bacteroidota bacterium]
MPPPSTSREIVSTLEGLRALGPQWDRLASRFSAPILSHDWFSSAAAALHSHDRLAVFVRKSGDDIVAIAPFVQRRRLGLKSLEFIGSSTLSEPSGILYDHPSHLRGILDDVSNHGLPVNIDRVNDPIIVAELSKIAGGSVDIIRNSLATSPWIRIDGSWEAYYETITPKWRSAHRRAMKRAETTGPVSYDFISPGPSEFGELMDRFVSVEGECWKGRLGTALRTNDPLRTFFELYGRAAAAHGMLRFAFMRIGGTPVAAQLAVEYARRYWLLKIGYDERFSQCSPGILLMYKTLERAFNDGLEAFEFLGSNEGWIQIWSPKLHRYYARSIDSMPVRRLLAAALGLSERVNRNIRTRLARTGKRS